MYVEFALFTYKHLGPLFLSCHLLNTFFGANLILLNLTMNVVAYHFPLCDSLLAGI